MWILQKCIGHISNMLNNSRAHKNSFRYTEIINGLSRVAEGRWRRFEPMSVDVGRSNFLPGSNPESY